MQYTVNIDNFALPVLNGHNLQKQRCLVEISISNRTLSNLLSTRAQLVMACGPAACGIMHAICDDGSTHNRSGNGSEAHNQEKDHTI